MKMREKEQQCDPAEFMIILLKHMPVTVNTVVRTACRECLYMYTSEHTTVFVPAGFVRMKVCECVCWQGFEVVKGNFSRTFLRVGYHKIAEIPAGARNINIQETIKSRNYLGTHTHTHTYLTTGIFSA